MAAFSQTDLAQSFKPSASVIAGAAVYIYDSGSGSGHVTIELWDDLPNQAGANMLASGTGYFSAVGQWVYAGWPPLAVTPGTTYYLAFDSADAPGDVIVAGTAYDSYPNGMTFANPGYVSFPTFDYTFRTCITEPGVVSAIPTLGPLGLVVLLLALLATAVVRRKYYA